MAFAQAAMQSTDNPLDQTGLCLLSLDGGGVRGLSSLLILKALMAAVNEQRLKDQQPSVKPCELFDLIGGTSTGGIIAIMLGRLEMDVDECIDAYTTMFQEIFGKKGLPVNIWGIIKGRFDSVVLEECIEEILKKKGLSKSELFNDGKDRTCRVCVCAKAAEISTTVLLRSYDSVDTLNNIPATICEAVRATSAATSFFEPVTIGPRKRKFVDGGLGANNPVEQVWNEAQNIWCSGEVELREMLKCVVSVGTGNPGKKPIAEGAFKFFSETLVRMATQTEDTARVFIERHRNLYEQKRYFRFNVQDGLQGVGLEEYEKEALIDAATTEYMDAQETKSTSKACASNLKQKQFGVEISIKDITEWNIAQHTLKRRKLFSIIPFVRNDDFVSREAITADLDRLLKPYTSYRTAAIWGLGGCGKSQIALEYAYRRQKETSCSIFWVHADSEARFTQNYSQIATAAQLSPDLKGEDLLRAVQQWIEHQPSWLMILDNADDLKLFKRSFSSHIGEEQSPHPQLLQFIPRAACGAVLWTSRDGSIPGHLVGVNQGLQVSAMSNKESLTLFRNLSRLPKTQNSSNEDEELIELLERLPLAIAQAAAYIRKTEVSVPQYLKAFKESEGRQSNLLSQEFDDPFREGIPNSVMRTWLISMKQVAEGNPLAEVILNTIAFFDNQGLPFELLRAVAGPSFNEDDVLQSAGRLREYAFLQVQSALTNDLPIYEQHRLVQLAARRALTKEQTVSFAGKALRVIYELFHTGEIETWNACKLYLPHSIKVAGLREAENYKSFGSKLFARIGMYYWTQGRYSEAEQLQVEVLKLQKEVLREKHPDTITAMAHLAVTVWQQGRSSEAEQLQVEVLELRKEVLGEKHPNTITAMANLAATWEQQGRSSEAQQLKVKVLELRKEVLGEKHPDTITAMANLAVSWRQQGRSSEAEQLQVEVLELQKEVLGEKHPDTITVMANLAVTWWQQGRSSEAEQLQVEVLELQKEVLGEKHPDTVAAMANLAGTWWQQGRSREAEQLQIEVLELQKEVLGEKHPDTVAAMANLAGTWWQQGRSREAEQLQVEVLELQKEILGEQHPDTLTSMNNLAWTLRNQHRNAEALDLMSLCLELMTMNLGADHPNTRSCSRTYHTWKME